MEEVLIWFSHHPLVAILLAAIGIVVILYFVRKHFLRILLVLILTAIGYLLYLNGFFSKQNIDKVKTVSFTDVENKTESGLKDGFDSVKKLTADKAEKKADDLRDETKKEMTSAMTEEFHEATAAAAPPGAKKMHPPAAGGKTAVTQQSHQQPVLTKKDQPVKKKAKKPKDDDNAE